MMTGTSTIEDIDLNADVPCIGTGPDKPCPAESPADLIAQSCGKGRYPMCSNCWDGTLVGHCEVNAAIEYRDEHYRIVEVLR